jgi:hypothetical protein
MKRLFAHFACGTLLALFFATPALAGPREVPKGSELRDHLFTLARATVEETAGCPVRFAGSLKELDGWAFFNGSIADKSGKAIRIGGAESSDTVILWKKSGGAWELVKSAAGITDVSYASWPDEYGAPNELLFP